MILLAWLLGYFGQPGGAFREEITQSLATVYGFGLGEVELRPGTIQEGATRCCVTSWYFDEKWGNYKVKSSKSIIVACLPVYKPV